MADNKLTLAAFRERYEGAPVDTERLAEAASCVTDEGLAGDVALAWCAKERSELSGIAVTVMGVEGA